MSGDAAKSAIDSARAVSEGEELPLDKLQPYLQAQVPELAAGFSVEQFPGGHSNLTYLLRNNAGKEFVLRRPPLGLEIKSAHDMSREFKILSHLLGHYDKIPKPVHFCVDETVLGAHFYLMERIQGTILRSKQPPPGIDLSANVMRGLSTAVIDNLAAIHAVDYKAAGLESFGKPQGYIERQVKGWAKRYSDAKTDDIPEIERAAAWLSERLPKAESGAGVIHGDYKYDNIMLDSNDLTQIKAVFDWEMATIGDPLMDLGTTLSLWVDPDDAAQFQSFPFGPTSLPGNLSRQQLVERYAQQSGRNIDDVLYFFVFGLFKMSVVLQQIYKRYKLGHSKDQRFAMMILGVRAFGDTAARALDKGRIYGLG